MKTSVLALLRAALIPAALLSSCVRLDAIPSDQPSHDRAARMLNAAGMIPVEAAQRPEIALKVSRGDRKLRVLANLGEPVSRLDDDTWLYGRFTVEDSRATGVLVVWFQGDRVNDMKLLTPQRAAALRGADAMRITVIAGVRN